VCIAIFRCILAGGDKPNTLEPGTTISQKKPEGIKVRGFSTGMAARKEGGGPGSGDRFVERAGVGMAN